MASDRYIVVSVDSHAGADLQGYRPYLSRRWHDEFDAWAATYVDPWEMLGEGVDATEKSLPNLGVNWDSDVRLQAMDADGITAELIFPNTVPPFMPSNLLFGGIPSKDDYERRWAGVRAHNRWLVDFCGQAPDRRYGLAHIYLNSIENAVAEIRWAKDAGLKAVLIGAIPPGHPVLPQLFDRYYDPIWATCQELQMPVSQHAASGWPDNVDASDPVARAVLFTEATHYTNRSLTALIFGGVFERYPGLKYVFTEQTARWVPPLLTQLDTFWRARDSRGTTTTGFVAEAMRALPRPPHDYFSSNCFLATFMTPSEIASRDIIGIKNMMWAADFPHEEGSYPCSREAMRFGFAGVPEDDVRRMLGLNAIDVYGLDEVRLSAIAARVGPSVDEVQEPLTARPPAVNRAAYAFSELPA